MSPYRRPGSPYWSVRRAIPGMGEVRLTTGTKSAALARQYDQMLRDLKELGRLDAVEALRAGRVTFAQLYANRTPAKLNQLLALADSPLLRPLVEEWLAVGADDAGIRDRSMKRYATSWKQFWTLLPSNAKLSDLSAAFVSDFKRHRHAQAKALGKALSPATLNRDFAALGAFFTWCEQEKQLKFDRPRAKYHRESRGRVRWLSREELAAFRENCPAQWWPLFGLLFTTGLTISEALGLLRADVDLRTGRVSIHEEYGRKLKRESRTRELSIPEAFLPVLSSWLESRPDSPEERIFPFTYWPARKAWKAICKAAGIFGATVHDARHTFAVHAVQNGIPEARLQKLLGHSHPGTTRRYAMHSPEQFLDKDAQKISQGMGFAETVVRLVKEA